MWLHKLAQSFDLDELFRSSGPGETRRDPPTWEPYTLKLYRGFNGNLDEIHRDSGGQLILSPRKSEQNMIWFTHEFIRGYNPIAYAKSHGRYLLTYPLEVKRYFYKVHYEDGSSYEFVPAEFMELTNPTENCRFHAGIELPEGWVFTYKHEKFIGCTKELLVSRDMIQEVGTEDVAA